MNLEEAIKSIQSRENDFDTRYFGGWGDLICEAMETLSSLKREDWAEAVENVLQQEVDAGNLGRGHVNCDWKDVEARIRFLNTEEGKATQDVINA